MSPRIMTISEMVALLEDVIATQGDLKIHVQHQARNHPVTGVWIRNEEITNERIVVLAKETPA